MVACATLSRERNVSVISAGAKATGTVPTTPALLPTLSTQGNATGCLVRG